MTVIESKNYGGPVARGMFIVPESLDFFPSDYPVISNEHNKHLLIDIQWSTDSRVLNTIIFRHKRVCDILNVSLLESVKSLFGF